MPIDAQQRRSRWLWVSAALAVTAVGLLVWALTLRSDQDSTQEELDATSQQLSSTSRELDETKQQLARAQEELEAEETSDRRRRLGGALVAAGGLTAVKAVYDDMAEQLGATEDELAETQQDLATASEAADEAAADAKSAAKAATEADDAAAKAEAEKTKAEAEAEAEKAKSTVVKDCVRAYVTAFGELFEGDSPEDQAAGVRDQLATVSTDCRGALDGE